LDQPLVSIIVTNFNYAHFLPAALDSALRQTYRPCEIVVVDDGSTDGSRAIIERYGERVRPVLKANGGNISACNAGYLAASGEIVLFLDADDMLLPTAIASVVAAMAPRVSAVQIPVMTVDEAGQPLGAVLPLLPKRWTPADIRRAVRRAGFYPYPPTSGNAYPRWYLERLMPVALARVPGGLDGVLNGVAALHGDIVALRQPLVCYRFHGKNLGASNELHPERLHRIVSADLARNAFLLEEARRLGVPLAARTVERAFYFAQYRLASRKLRPDLHPIPGDRLSGVTLRFLEAAAVAPDRPLRRAVVAAWGLAVALAPRRLAQRLVALRFSAGARPPGLDRIFRIFGLVRRTRAQEARELAVRGDDGRVDDGERLATEARRDLGRGSAGVVVE
jgi:glycosyltransferase involved in cell wall biosynthesis